MSKRSNRSSLAAAAHRAQQDNARPATAAPSDKGRWLTRVAFGIAIAVVFARLLMSEGIRNPMPVYPGAADVPLGPGPSSGLLLDLLAGLCPLLVLLRRWIDPAFALRAAWASLLFLLLAGWAVASSLWASDRFAAIVSSCHLLAAAGVLWAMAQIVRTPTHLRLVAGICAGLLGVLLVQGLYHHFLDRQDLIDQWNANPAQILAARNIQPGSFDAIQLENKIRRGELMGFSASPNTYAAQLVLLGFVVLGTAFQAGRNRRWIAAGLLSAFVLVTALMLPLTQSRTAFLTGILGLFLFPLMLPLGPFLRRRATLFYVLGVIGFMGVVAFVVGYGMSRGTLFHDSLNFRWRYWTGSFDVWKTSPLLGVGWENFGAHYLGVRIPEATEEIKDPHNFLVRFFTELGIVGGLLSIAWMALTWWTLSRSGERQRGEVAAEGVNAKAASATVPVSLVGLAVGAVAFGMVLNFFASVDTAQSTDFALFEGIRRVAFFVVAMVLFALAWLTRTDTEEGSIAFDVAPAPLIRLGLVVGLGMFFIHNLIDFAMFETGPMFLMALLLGTSLGSSGAAPAPAPYGRRIARLGLAVGGAVWLIGAVLVVIPIVSSEAVAQDADESFRKGVAVVAARGYESAFQNAVRNADYAHRAAMAWDVANDTARSRVMLDQAIAADPVNAAYLLARAELLLSKRPTDFKQAATDLEGAVRLDPNNRYIRTKYADALEKLNMPREAAAQLRTILDLNERLTKDEKKRMSPAEVAQMQTRATQLEKSR